VQQIFRARSRTECNIFRARSRTGCNILSARSRTGCNRSFAQDHVQGATDLSHIITYMAQQIVRTSSRTRCNIFRARSRTGCNRSFAYHVQGATDLSHKIVYTEQRCKFIRWTVWNFYVSTSSSDTDVERYVTIRRKLTIIFSTYFRRSYAGGKFKHTELSISVLMFSICFLLYHVAPAKQLVWAGQVNVAVTCERKLTQKETICMIN